MTSFDPDIYVAIRNSQVALALAALQLDPDPAIAFVAEFEQELAHHILLGSAAHFPYLRLHTTARDSAATGRLSGLLVADYGFDSAAATQPKQLEENLGYGLVHAGLDVWRDREAPSLRFGLAGSWSHDEVSKGLVQLGVERETAQVWKEVATMLDVDRVNDVTVELQSPGEAPRFVVAYPLVFALEDLEDFQSRIRLITAALGVSEAQREWFAAMARSFAPRRMNAVHLRMRLSLDAPPSELTVSYPVIPARLVLRLLSQFANEDMNGRRLGGMTGAVGIEEEIVSHLDLVAHDSEPPRITFDVEVEGPPAVASD